MHSVTHPLRVGALVFVLAFVINGVWEVLQMSWYSGEHGSLVVTFLHCLPAILFDGLFILTLYALLPHSGGHSIPNLTLPGLFLLGIAGAVMAMAIEVLAVSSYWWSYRASMPRIPLLGIGLFPVMQLGLLTPLTFLLLGWLLDRGIFGLKKMKPDGF